MSADVLTGMADVIYLYSMNDAQLTRMVRRLEETPSETRDQSLLDASRAALARLSHVARKAQW